MAIFARFLLVRSSHGAFRIFTVACLQFFIDNTSKSNFKQNNMATKIVAFGNPLLDTTIKIQNNDLLNKYDLEEDGQKEITENEMKSLLDDIKIYEKRLSAGGCAQNSLRVLKWLLQEKCNTFIFGSVGKDAESHLLEQLVNIDGVQTRYIQQDQLPTGRTVALVSKLHRSLVAHIGAAERLPLTNLIQHKDFPNLILTSTYVYVEGFFLTNRSDAALHILDLCNSNKIPLIFNICGVYILKEYFDIVKCFVEKSNIVFGNKLEFEALSIKMQFPQDVEKLAKHLIETNNSVSDKIIVITDGPHPVRVLRSKYPLLLVNVPPIPSSELIDTTGAGDSFVAGFIAGLVLNKSMDDCCKLGCYASSVTIKEMGCTVPKYQPSLD